MLYQDLAAVYDALYQQLFDYDAEFQFYHAQMQRFNAQSVIEIGCGTGHLAERFSAKNVRYLGVDLSMPMLEIAQKRVPKGLFVKRNMTDLNLVEGGKMPLGTYDMALITGRTISYLIDNQQVIKCLKSISQNLAPNGILIFDAIDAADLFGNAKIPTTDVLEKDCGIATYKRTSVSFPNLKTGWTWDWKSTYFEKRNATEYAEIGRDYATLRAFTWDEIQLFLKIGGFEVVEMIKKETYAWQDYFYICRKMG